MPLTHNDCICCAERKLIYNLQRCASKSGVAQHKFSVWIHRKFGRMVVWRIRKDGIMGMSLPCVICRKQLDKYRIEWVAHLGVDWYSSRDESPPRSKPTQKQCAVMGFQKPG
jgi:hypothetical protein